MNFGVSAGKRIRAYTSPEKTMSKEHSILLFSIIGFYAVLCMALLLRACAGYLAARWQVAPAKIRKVSSAVGLTRRRKAWTRAVWRGNLAH